MVERNGGVITTRDVEKFRRLPKLVGAGAPEAPPIWWMRCRASRHRRAHRRLCSAFRERRWNLILDDGVVVKLPEDGWQKQLDALEHLIVDKGILERDVTRNRSALADALFLRAARAARRRMSNGGKRHEWARRSACA